MSIRSVECARGTTSAWPWVAGLMSMKATVRSSESTISPGSSPATILQKMQSSSIGPESNRWPQRAPGAPARLRRRDPRPRRRTPPRAGRRAARRAAAPPRCRARARARRRESAGRGGPRRCHSRAAGSTSRTSSRCAAIISGAATAPDPRADMRSAAVRMVTSGATSPQRARYSNRRRRATRALMDHEPEVKVVAREPLDVAAERPARVQTPQRLGDEVGADGVVADERHVAGVLAPGRRLADVVHQRAQAQALAAREAVAERLGRADRAPRPRSRRRSVEVRLDLEQLGAGPRSCGRGRRGDGSGSARRREARRARAAPRRSRQARPAARTPGSDRGRRPAGAARRAGARPRARPPARASARASSTVPASISKPSDAARRAARSSRSGSSANARSETARSDPPLEVAEAAGGSIGLASSVVERHRDRVDREVALLEVGRDVAPRRAVTSTCQAPSRRQRPPGPELLGERERGAADGAGDRLRGVRLRPGSTTTSASTTGRPSAASRTAPPTTHAGPSTASARGADRRRGAQALPQRAHRTLPLMRTRHPRRDPAGDLVVDRAQGGGDLLREDALAAARADQHGLGAGLDGRLGPQVDGDVVHRHRSDERIAAPVDQHVSGVREPAAHTVAVADRQHADAGVRSAPPSVRP